jgi:hypothetical protein
MFRLWHKSEVLRRTCFVPRCSYCGRYEDFFYRHWFFHGFYCIGCLQEVLFDNTRTIAEINDTKEWQNKRWKELKEDETIHVRNF